MQIATDELRETNALVAGVEIEYFATRKNVAIAYIQLMKQKEEDK
jgi:hypothetical protein